MLKSTIFREYDIRGIAEAELQDPDVHDLGRAIGTYLQRHNGRNISLGRDCRLSSDRISSPSTIPMSTMPDTTMARTPTRCGQLFVMWTPWLEI